MNSVKRGLQFLVSLLFPLLVITCVLRLALTPLFIQVEYRLPGFPQDIHGFTTAERIEWAQVSINYLLERVPQEEFNRQTLPDGSPLFNSRELAHMLDVRILTALVMRIWLGLSLFYLFLLAVSLRQQWMRDFLRALHSGALFTFLLIGLILLGVWLNFEALFTQFHLLLFEGDTWLFYLSDNLIRLFPMHFWRDLFIFIGACVLLLCALVVCLWRSLSKRERQKAH